MCNEIETFILSFSLRDRKYLSQVGAKVGVKVYYNHPHRKKNPPFFNYRMSDTNTDSTNHYDESLDPRRRKHLEHEEDLEDDILLRECCPAGSGFDGSLGCGDHSEDHSQQNRTSSSSAIPGDYDTNSERRHFRKIITAFKSYK